MNTVRYERYKEYNSIWRQKNKKHLQLYNKKYRQTEKFKLARRDYDKKYQLNHPYIYVPKVRKIRVAKILTQAEKESRILLARQKNTEKARRYRQTTLGKAAIRRANAKYEQANPQRKIAWSLAKCLEKYPCKICGIEQTHKHHPDPVKPLEVIYLCPLHHKQIHMT